MRAEAPKRLVQHHRAAPCGEQHERRRDSAVDPDARAFAHKVETLARHPDVLGRADAKHRSYGFRAHHRRTFAAPKCASSISGSSAIARATPSLAIAPRSITYT